MARQQGVAQAVQLVVVAVAGGGGGGGQRDQIQWFGNEASPRVVQTVIGEAAVLVVEGEMLRY